MSMGADLIAPVMCSNACLWILASLPINPLVPLQILEPGTRNRSAAYIILGMATAMKNHLMNLADTPFDILASLWYCITHFTPFCTAYWQFSFKHSYWSNITPRNLCVAAAGTLTP